MNSYLLTTQGDSPVRKWVDADSLINARALFVSRMKADGVDLSGGVVCLDQSGHTAIVRGSFPDSGIRHHFSVKFEPSTGRRLEAEIDGVPVAPSSIPDATFRVAVTYNT